MMHFEPGILGETASFFAGVYCGVLTGMLYDVFGLLRLPFRSPWAAALLDMLYYAVGACLWAAALLYINCGTFRLYIYLAIGCGVLLYRIFPGRLARHCAEKFTKKQLHRKH